MAAPSGDADVRYMRRALELAARGAGFVSPNPMVGAVVVADGRIIGEGYHRVYGGPHAEVNAIASVSDADRLLLRDATMYVTLEPCSHYGKTPPCARLLVETGIRRCVVACRDPFEKVAGRGIAMLRGAGMEVTERVLEAESRWLNRRFVTAHTLRRPYVTLKWAQTSDSFIGSRGADGRPSPMAVSDDIGIVAVHRLRAVHDAVMAGTGTLVADRPSLTVRHWPCRRQPLRVSFESPGLAAAGVDTRGWLLLDPALPLADNLAMLYERHGVTSLLVEGGASLLRSFMSAGLWEEIRRETSPRKAGGGIAAPALPPGVSLLGRGRAGDSLTERFARV